MPKGIFHNYTNQQHDFLNANKTMPRAKLTCLFNQTFKCELSVKAIAAYCKRHGFLTGRTGQIKKGNKPWNTGTKGVCKGSSTSFKKGSIPANLKPIGHERICSKDGFVLIKVEAVNPYTGAKTRYRPKHHVVWEKANGEIPEGMVIRFIDGDQLNCDIDNLMCVSKSLNLRLNKNKVNELPPELKETGFIISTLEVATFDAMGNM